MEREHAVPLGAEVIESYGVSRLRSPEGWLALAPLAVHTDWRRRGRATASVRRLCERMALEGRTLVVLGEVGFYERAGFSAARAGRLMSPHAVEHTLLSGPGDDAPEATLAYPPAFSEV